MDSLLQDLRYALRMLARSPGFTAAAVLALGLGMGATTAIYSVLNGVVLRPLAYPRPHELVMFWETDRGKGLDHELISPVNFLDYRNLHHVFTDAAAWWKPDVNFTAERHEPIRANTVEVSGNFFSVMGIQPLVGRGFPAAPLHERVEEVIVSHRLWQNHLNGDPAVIGRTVGLNGRAFQIVGVMPAGFNFPDDTDVWQRLEWDLSKHSRGAHFMEGVGRLRPGATVEQANLELGSLTRRLASEFAATNSGWSARVVKLDVEIAGFFRPALYLLFAAVGLLLLIGCLNVANLLLARATTREREVAVRVATGASRGRLIRQFLIESGVLAALSTALGLVVAVAGVKALVLAAPIAIPRLDQVTVDKGVLAFAALLTVVTAFAFGVIPALFMSKTELTHALKEGGRGHSAGHGGRRLRGMLVVTEIALSVTLLVGAGLLMRSFGRLVDQDPGLRPEQVLTANIQLAERSESDAEWMTVGQFYSQLLDSIRTDPAVRSASASNFLPLEPGWRMPFLFTGRPQPKSGEEPTAQHHSIDEEYFRTLGVPLLRGRVFDKRDTPESQGVVIINDAASRRWWPNENPVGKTIVSLVRVVGPLGRSLMVEREHQIVGVVADVRNNTLKNAAEPAIYHTERQFPFRNMYLVVRGQGDPAQLASVIRNAVRRLDPGIPVSNIRTMEGVLAEPVQQPRFLMLVMSGFAVLALLLAAIGIYGILAYAVGQRRQEISIRMALGARPGSVLWLIVREGLRLTVAGAVLGLAGAYLTGRALSSLLFGVHPADAVTFSGAVLVILVAGLTACVLPARRAAAVDPVRGLRAD